MKEDFYDIYYQQILEQVADQVNGKWAFFNGLSEVKTTLESIPYIL